MADLPRRLQQNVIKSFNDLADDLSTRPPESIVYLFDHIMTAKAPDYNTLKPECQDLDTCRALVGQNTELATYIKSLLEPRERLFELLSHEAFRKPRIASNVANSSEGHQDQAAAMAWNTPYLGTSDKLLEQAIHEMNHTRGTTSFANFVPIIQSSGTGKSRAIDQVARRVFTLPFNLRPTEDKSGFPSADPFINTFMRPKLQEKKSKLRTRYLVFLNALFESVSEKIKSLDNYGSPEDFAYAFYNTLRRMQDDTVSVRNDLYYDVITKTKSRLNDRGKSKKDLVTDVTISCERLTKTICEKSGVPWVSRNNGMHGRGRPVRLLIYFDEAHGLTELLPVQNEWEPYTAYEVLYQVLNELKQYDLFTVFISSKHRITSFRSPEPVSPTMRIMYISMDPVQPPFVELGFDMCQETLLKENAHSLVQVCKPSFMVRFGRPLFWTRFEHGDQRIQQEIVEFAQAKLGGVPLSQELTESGQLAVLSQRLGLSFAVDQERARAMQDTLIENHMRIVFSVPAHREYVRSGTPSEPILAEAAARLMATKKVLNQGVPTVLVEWLADGLVEDDREDLVARYLLARAHDIAVDQLFGGESGRAMCYTYPVPLPTFLESLFGPDRAKQMLEAFPDNQPEGLSLGQSSLGSAFLNFTHWAKAGDDSAVKDDTMWIALARSMAWQCLDDQVDVDLVTPLALSEDEGLGRQNTSAIFWQVKRRSTSQPPEIDAEKLDFFSLTQETTPSRPYITIVLDLDTDPKAIGKLVVSKGQIDPSEFAENAPKSPRYAFVVTGCDNTIFPSIIGPDQGDVFAKMLGLGGLLDDDPRSENNFQRALADMKLEWRGKPGAQHSYRGVEFEEPHRFE